MSGSTSHELKNPDDDAIVASYSAAVLAHLMDSGSPQSAVAMDPRTPAETLEHLATQWLEELQPTAKTMTQAYRTALVNKLVDLATNPSLTPQVFALLNVVDLPQVRATLATNPACPPLMLAVFAQDPEPFVRRAVASHAQTEPPVLADLAYDPERTVVEAVVGNPNTPMQVLHDLVDTNSTDVSLIHAAVRNPRFGAERVAAWANHAQRTVRRLIAAHPNLPVENQQQFAWGKDTACQTRLASNPSLDPLLASALCNPEGTLATRLMLAENEHIPVSITARLLVDPDWKVRANAARDPRLEGSNLIQVLVDEEDTHVLASLINHPNLPDHAVELVLDKIEGSTDESRGFFAHRAEIYDAVAHRPKATGAMLRRVATGSTTNGILHAVLAHASCPHDLLREATESVERWERAAVAVNPNAPADLLTRLAMDPEPLVRFLVTRHPHCTDEIATLAVMSGDLDI